MDEKFVTVKDPFRQAFDRKVNELLNKGYEMIDTPKALQESYKDDGKAYKQITFICFMKKKE